MREEATKVIEVTVVETGDCAEAQTPEAALLAAKTLAREAVDAAAGAGFEPHVRFTNGGEFVREVSWRELHGERR